jgi:hypothetical protein
LKPYNNGLGIARKCVWHARMKIRLFYGCFQVKVRACGSGF